MYTTSREENDMAPETMTTTRPKHRVVAPAETRTQLRLTVDSKFTKSHFNQLFAVLKIRRKNALAEHIIMSFKSKTAQTQLVAFYNNQWLNIPFQSIDTAFVFPLTYEIADELERDWRRGSLRSESVQGISRDGGLLRLRA
jgi:3'-phosphoadenosine 5'-phosphosulfate sulfotransferase (PAPS reductase)/FAD synthetase